MNPPGWSPAHRALLRCLLGAAPAAEGVAWLRAADLDGLDHETARLLPRLYHQLRAEGVAEADLPPRVKGLVRHTWTRNQALLHEAAPALAELTRRAVPWRLVGGAAVLAATGGDLSARPLRDLDLLVRPADLPATAEALHAAGWRTHVRDPQSLVQWFHRVRWTAPHGLLDVHVRPLLEDRDSANLALAWSGARTATLGTLSVALPPPDILLLSACVAGWFTPRPPALMWALDAADLLRSGGMEEETLAELATRAGLAGPFDFALSVLSDLAPRLVPEALRLAIPARPCPHPALRWHDRLGSGPRLWRAHREAGGHPWFPAAAQEATGLSVAAALARRWRRTDPGDTA
jgi:hypothetical protein